MIRFAAAIVLTCSGGALAQASDEMLNTPAVTAWSVYGPGQTQRLRKDRKVQGGGALAIAVTAAANPWDVGAVAPVSGAVAKDDAVLVAFWGRLASPGSAAVPVFLQAAAPPHAPVIAGQVTLGDAWQLVSIKGRAPAAHAAGATNVVLHLGAGAHRVELGPVFVMRVK